MRPAHYFVLALVMGAVSSRRITFNEPGMPIRVVDTSYGKGMHERVDYLEAVIQQHHVNNQGRINFPSSGYLNDYFLQGKADGDERGHLVGSQFSGPAEWYNLSPQNARVNRNAGFQSITTDWYGAECEVRSFLDKGGNRYVIWKVRMTYVKDSNRPDQYHLQVQYIKDGKPDGNGIDTHIRNPFLKEDSTFWLCRGCKSNSHDQNSHCQRQK